MSAKTAIFVTMLSVTALWLMWGISWRVALGVFLFVWGNNLMYSSRLKRTIQSGVWK